MARLLLDGTSSAERDQFSNVLNQFQFDYDPETTDEFEQMSDLSLFYALVKKGNNIREAEAEHLRRIFKHNPNFGTKIFESATNNRKIFGALITVYSTRNAFEETHSPKSLTRATNNRSRQAN